MRASMRDLLKIIREEGYTVVEVQQNKHIKVRVAKDGVAFMLISPLTSSDTNRWLKNMRRDLGRAYRQAIGRA